MEDPRRLFIFKEILGFLTLLNEHRLNPSVVIKISNNLRKCAALISWGRLQMEEHCSLKINRLVPLCMYSFAVYESDFRGKKIKKTFEDFCPY